MFGIRIKPSLSGTDQVIVDNISEPGFNPRDYREAHRSNVPIVEFDFYADPEAFSLACPVCGSTLVDDECIDDYGGTSSGWTACRFCGYTTSWADLSAVI